MARLNTPFTPYSAGRVTHEGAPARDINPVQALRRSVMSCLLWEDTFYESGEDIADRIVKLCQEVSAPEIAAIAVEARNVMNLRHVPLLLLVGLSSKGAGSLTGDTIAQVIQRPDEMAELLAMYWRAGKRPLPAQMKKGLAKAIGKFDEYQLAKYNRDGQVKLRDVLFLTHPKPANDEQQALWNRLAEGTLATPDTWEVSLSGGSDKKETFERMLKEGKLGYLALLRNLRNMDQAGVDETLVKGAILARKGAQKVLPFRYIAAARACPRFEPELDKALKAAIADIEPLPGKTIVMVDTSGSMENRLSARSDMTRKDAASALGAIIPGDVRTFAFASGVEEVPRRLGMAGVDAFQSGRVGHGTNIDLAVETANRVGYDRLIIITDEQSWTQVRGPQGKGYMINVASYKNGVGYGPWTHIDGWSEGVLRYIREIETL